MMCQQFKLTTDVLPAVIKPEIDLSALENVDFAIFPPSEISLIVLACLLGQSIKQLINPR